MPRYAKPRYARPTHGGRRPGAGRKPHSGMFGEFPSVPTRLPADMLDDVRAAVLLACEVRRTQPERTVSLHHALKCYLAQEAKPDCIDISIV